MTTKPPTKNRKDHEIEEEATPPESPPEWIRSDFFLLGVIFAPLVPFALALWIFSGSQRTKCNCRSYIAGVATTVVGLILFGAVYFALQNYDSTPAHRPTATEAPREDTTPVELEPTEPAKAPSSWDLAVKVAWKQITDEGLQHHSYGEVCETFGLFTHPITYYCQKTRLSQTMLTSSELTDIAVYAIAGLAHEPEGTPLKAAIHAGIDELLRRKPIPQATTGNYADQNRQTDKAQAIAAAQKADADAFTAHTQRYLQQEEEERRKVLEARAQKELVSRLLVVPEPQTAPVPESAATDTARPTPTVASNTLDEFLPLHEQYVTSFRTVLAEVRECSQEREKATSAAQALETRVNNLNIQINRMGPADTHRERVTKERDRLQTLLVKAAEKARSFSTVEPRAFAFDATPQPHANSRITRRSMTRKYEQSFDLYEVNPDTPLEFQYDALGNRLARVHSAILELTMDFPDLAPKAKDALAVSAALLNNDNTALTSTTNPRGSERKIKKIMVRHDGTEIPATMVAETQNTYAVMTLDGKTIEIKKQDVRQIREP